ncbi:UNVERIFIED_CONTAM: hypothetical protein PYX00_004962 [Menopon gallinae]|uniref:C3H1-type domain-containing protein n=1 Tax=Menopon gallinae TaxID=328185 RepID=A0AAW2I806_9NEOP
MFFNCRCFSSQEEDLEDGEIASDDEGVSEPAQAEEAKEEKPIKKPEPVVTSPSKPPKTTKPQCKDNDFEKDLQKLRKDFERKKERRDPKKVRDNNERDIKKRKRRGSEEIKNRKEKRRKVEGNKNEEKDEEDDIDEDDMLGLCIRGGSPTINLEKTEVWSGKQPIMDSHWQFSDNSENESEFEDRDDRKRRRRDKERRNFKSNAREDREIKKRIQMKRKGKSRKESVNGDMICINFMKGNCNKGNDCFYSHSVCPPKKMELCKFYLMDCCAKRDKCLYLHDEFPCKFFHTGLKCYSGKKCKFSHDPLNSLSKDILLKHLETAPKEILGDFPRLSRDYAESMVNNKTTGKPVDTSKIPSLFDIQVSIPPEFQNSVNDKEERTTPPCSPPPNVKTSPKTRPKDGMKYYEDSELNDDDQDQGSDGPIDFAKELEAYKNKQLQSKNSDASQEREFENTTPNKGDKSDSEGKAHKKHRKHRDDEDEGESEEKEEKRRKRKHEDKHKKDKQAEDDDEDDRGARKERRHKGERREKRPRKDSDADKSENLPVRVSDDGSFGGIKFRIINKKEIRKNSTNSESEALLPAKIDKPNEFLSSDDERPLNYLLKSGKQKEEVEDKLKEEEMEEFGVEIKQDVEDETDENEIENALIIETNDDQEEEEKSEPIVPKHLPKKQQELFLRIQAQQSQKEKEDAERKRREQEEQRETGGGSVKSGSGSEEEVGRTPSPEPADENWYSSDDEETAKVENPLKSVLQNLNTEKKPVLPQNPVMDADRSLTPPPKPKIEITALNDLTKINITELLSSIRQVTNKSRQNAMESPVEKKEIKDPRLRDPRINPELKASAIRRNSGESNKPPAGKSIYDSANFKIETEDSDMRFETKYDSDERIKNLESIVPYGDIDLRTLGRQNEQSSGDSDFDLRKFGLPFKPVPVHSAATEIDASINSHPPINYKVETILIPRPDFSSIKISPNDPQVKKDPRLRRLFRINSSENDQKEELKKSGAPTDPRQRKPVITDTPKSPTESPFSPKQSEQNVLGNNQNLLSANLLLLAQLGLSAAAGLDPRVQLLNKTPQEMEMLRNQLSSLENQADFDFLRKQLVTNETLDMIRAPNPGLLPTPMPTPGMGLLGPAPGFMMPGMGMPDPSVMMGPMGPMGPNPMGFEPRFNQNANEEDMNDNNDNSNRHFNRGFRGDRRGRGNWRGNRDRNWDRDNRRHTKRDDRDRNRHTRGRDDRRERKRSNTPD